MATLPLLMALALAGSEQPPLVDQAWAEKPTVEDIARVYPEAPLARNSTAWTTLQCRARADGRLADCVVAEEAPKGHGFGAAALKLAPLFRLEPRKDGVSLDGASVRLPIRWDRPD